MEKEAFGSRLRETRAQKGYTLQSHAQKAGTGTLYLGAAERGLKMPSLDSFIKNVEAYLSNQFDMINVTLFLNFVK